MFYADVSLSVGGVIGPWPKGLAWPMGPCPWGLAYGAWPFGPNHWTSGELSGGIAMN